MVGRVVEIAEEGRSISSAKGFLVVEAGGIECGRIPFDDIAALILSARHQTMTRRSITALAERGVPVVFCGRNYKPAALVWPVEQHHEQAGRMIAQAAMAQPLKKRLWQVVVQRKLCEQAALLEALGRPDSVLKRLAAAVRSGDAGNAEAQGARRYWQALFGSSFRRNPDLDGVNALLNYGYAVLRAAAARAVAAAGLHPSFGIFHRDPQNAFQLVDDLMEPYRPRIDAGVWQLSRDVEAAVTPITKRCLALTLFHDCSTPDGRTPLARCLWLTASSLVTAIDERRPKLFFPEVLEKRDLDGPTAFSVSGGRSD